MIDTARAEPVLIEKHGRGVVIIAVEEYERLTVRPDSQGKTCAYRLIHPRH
jgi:PHD/YefM family antitoxin component YafN of YafNO toxin-antitoxin module